MKGTKRRKECRVGPRGCGIGTPGGSVLLGFGELAAGGVCGQHTEYSNIHTMRMGVGPILLQKRILKADVLGKENALDEEAFSRVHPGKAGLPSFFQHRCLGRKRPAATNSFRRAIHCQAMGLSGASPVGQLQG